MEAEAVIGYDGKPFTTASIGGAIATRFIMADLRAGMDGIGGGPAPFAKADRSRFCRRWMRRWLGWGECQVSNARQPLISLYIQF